MQNKRQNIIFNYNNVIEDKSYSQIIEQFIIENLELSEYSDDKGAAITFSFLPPENFKISNDSPAMFNDHNNTIELLYNQFVIFAKSLSYKSKLSFTTRINNKKYLKNILAHEIQHAKNKYELVDFYNLVQSSNVIRLFKDMANIFIDEYTASYAGNKIAYHSFGSLENVCAYNKSNIKENFEKATFFIKAIKAMGYALGEKKHLYKIGELSSISNKEKLIENELQQIFDNFFNIVDLNINKDCEKIKQILFSEFINLSKYYEIDMEILESI